MFLIFWNATIKWCKKTGSTIREASTNLVGATLADSFYRTTSVFFMCLAVGIIFPLRRYYKNHFTSFIIADNFTLFRQVEQQMGWETFFNVTLKQLGGDRPPSMIGEGTSPPSPSSASPKMKPSEGTPEVSLSNSGGTPGESESSSLELQGGETSLLPDTSFLDRVDIYPDLLVLKLNERWRGLVDQQYAGLFSVKEVFPFPFPKGDEDGVASGRKVFPSTQHVDRATVLPVFARRRIDLFSRRTGSTMVGSSRSRGRSHPLLEAERRGSYHAQEWFYAFSMPWDEIPFKLESESVLYDTLFGSKSASDRAPTPSVIPSSEAEAFTKGEGEAVPFSHPLPQRGWGWEVEGRRRKEWREAIEKYGNKAVEELVDQLVEEETPWDQVLANDAIDVRSMSGHRCPDIERSRFKALLLFQWSQRLLSLRPVPPPTLKSMSGWQKFIQTVHIPLPAGLSLTLPHLFSPFDPPLPWVDVQYQHVKLAGLKRFETTFQKSAEGVLASNEVELMPLEEMMYYGPSVGKGKHKVENDVVSWQEKGSDRGWAGLSKWGIDAFGANNPLAIQQHNFFGKKSVLPGEPVTRRLVSMGGQHRRMMLPWPWHHDSEFLSPPAKSRQVAKNRLFNLALSITSSRRRLTPFDPENLDQRRYPLIHRAVENAFLSAAPVNEEPLITTIQPDDWNRMVEAQIDGATEVGSQTAKFDLEFPIIAVAQRTGRPFLWPLTQLDSRSFHRFILQQRGVEGRVFPSSIVPVQAGMKQEPQVFIRAHHESLRPIHELAPYSSLIDPLHLRKVTHFREKGWRAKSTWSSSPSLLTKVRGEIRGTRRRGELWEPTTMLSWMMIYKLLFVLWMHRLGGDFYRSYGKEILVYFITLLASLGFDAESLIEDLGLGEDPSYFRIISATERRFRDLAGIDTTLPTLGEIVWFLRSSGRGKRVPKGILLVGPPGTGKTFLVQAVAGEAEVPVVIQSAALLIDPEQRESPVERLKKVFEQARRSAPCILFIDEIDTLGASRDGVMQNTMGVDKLVESVMTPHQVIQEDSLQEEEGSHVGSDPDSEAINEAETFTFGDGNGSGGVLPTKESISEETALLMEKQRLSLLMQLLVELDGLHSLPGLVVVGATNRPAVLDPALLRPGRFEKVVHLELPGKEKRIDILQLYSRSMGIAQDVSWRYLAHRTLGFSAADLSAVMNQSTIQAILNNTTHTIETVETGIETIGRKMLQKGLPDLTFSSASPTMGKQKFLDPFLPARLASYQAGKAVVQTTLPPHLAVSYLTLWPHPDIQSGDPKENLLDRSSCHTLRRLGLEARVIGLHAGKAGEFFALADTLSPHPHPLWGRGREGEEIGQQGAWDSDLGTEETRLGTRIAASMIDDWYLQSKESLIKERNRTRATQSRDEIEEPSEREFYKRLAEEQQLEGEDARSGPQNHFVSAWWQSQVTKEVELVQLSFSRWSRIYLPDPAESARNEEWIPPDENYHFPSAFQNRAISHGKGSLPWTEFDRLDRDYIVHGFVTTCLNEAFFILEGRRELFDYFADHLIRFHLLRRHTIQIIDLQFLR